MLVDTLTTTDPEKTPPFGVITGVTTWCEFVNAAVDTYPGAIPLWNAADLSVMVLVKVSAAVYAVDEVVGAVPSVV